MRARWIVLLAVVAIGAGASLYAYLSLDAIVKRRIEKLGTSIAGADLTVDDVELSLREGSGRISGIRLENPPGFSDDAPALEIDEIAFRLEPASVAERPIVLDEVTIGPPRVNVIVDGSGQSNFGIIDQHARSGPAGAREVGRMPLVIGRLTLAPGSVNVTAPSFLPNVEAVPLERVVLSDLGSRDAPVTAAEVAQQVERALVHHIALAVAKTELDRLVYQKLGGTARQVSDALFPRSLREPVESAVGHALDAGAGFLRDTLRDATGRKLD
jgi:hypothetical protein